MPNTRDRPCSPPRSCMSSFMASPDPAESCRTAGRTRCSKTERNLDWMAAVLAIFKAGGAYLPIEPHFPADRIARTLSRAGCRLVLTERGSTAMLDQALDSLSGAHLETDAICRSADIPVRSNVGSTSDVGTGEIGRRSKVAADRNVRAPAAVSRSAPLSGVQKLFIAAAYEEG